MPSSSESAALATGGRLLAPLRAALPRGGALPLEQWRRRHRVLVAALWANALLMSGYSLVVGDYGALHNLGHSGALLTFAALASSDRLGRKFRSAAVSLGFLTAAALLVHLTGGLIEAHFYFFVVIVVLTLYEDWFPFLLAVAYVLVHHGAVGMIEPHEVYNRPEAWAHPWTWAGIHAFFVALAGAAGVGAWRLNEDVRDKMRETQDELAHLSETDSLTGLWNRRRAMSDLAELFEAAPHPSVLVLFDLNGFKSYNDRFGHPAGDSLLTILGQRLQSAVGDRAVAYRLGGDEFCLLGPGSRKERAALEAIAGAALSERGEAFHVTASYGSALIPEEAESPSEAMRKADQRMYARKHSSRPSAERQSKDVLLQALTELRPELGDRVSGVAKLVEPLGRRLGLPAEELHVLRHASELHDIGKMAIPDAIINKPGPLDEAEWEFMRTHTVIGQRIVGAAPVLAGVGALIRCSHEHWDGAGYPDGLAGDEIPLGARIIAVCDAYHAMTNDRPYRLALAPQDAMGELQRCAGTQFDPDVVAAFEAFMAEPQELRAVPPPEQAAQLRRTVAG